MGTARPRYQVYNFMQQQPQQHVAIDEHQRHVWPGGHPAPIFPPRLGQQLPQRPSGQIASNSTPLPSDKSSLSEQQMRDLRQIFDWLDYNGNGDISASELLVALKALTPSATIEQAEEFIKEATGSAKTSLGWMEFCRVIEKGLHKGAGSTAAQMFELVSN